MSHSSTEGSTSHTNARQAHGLLMIRLRARLVYGDIRRKRHKGCQSKEEDGAGGGGGGGGRGHQGAHNRKCAVKRSQGDIFSRQIESGERAAGADYRLAILVAT